MKTANGLLLMTLVAGLGSIGCGHHHHHEVYAEPVPVGYVYEPGYYDRGYYRDSDWYWRDRGGRLYREPREEHDRHMRDFGGRYEERR